MAANAAKIAVLFLFSVNVVFGIEDYCSENTYNSSETVMHFTKEATFEEFAVIGKFKGLHCCAKGYRSIEWYKDGQPYPWALPVSHLILFPESANQTIYVTSISEDDGGNYTCVLRNDTVLHSHTVHLKVFEKVPDDPKITYMSQNTNVAVGAKLRLFCEAFGGEIDLPDAHSEAVWKKVAPNDTIHDLPPHVQQLKSNREDRQVFGTYLMIPNVKNEDFGEYVCIISKPGNTIQRRVSIREKVKDVGAVNPNPVPVGKMILVMSVIFFIILVMVVLYLQYGLKLQVRIKDSFSGLEENDGKINDVLIVHSQKDSEIACVLMSTLENHYSYKCSSRTLSTTPNMWYSDLHDDAQKCRRIIALISPAVVNEHWDASSILQALKQLQSLGPKFVCVALKELPKNQNEVKNSQGETLASLSRSVGVIFWERKNEAKFWYALRLSLPPKRRTEIVENRNATQGENNSRLTSNSEESLYNLV